MCVQTIHDKAIIHNDLKLANMLLPEPSESAMHAMVTWARYHRTVVKDFSSPVASMIPIAGLPRRAQKGILIDFDSCQLLPKGKQSMKPSRECTSPYISPEAAAGGDISTAHNVYGFGVCLGEMVLGGEFEDGVTIAEIKSTLDRRSLKKTLKETILACLDHDPKNCPKISDVVNTIEGLLTLP